MRRREFRSAPGNRRSAWLALGLLPMLTGCLGAAVIPILASGPLLGSHHIRAATAVPKTGHQAAAKGAKSKSTAKQGNSQIVLTSLKELPPAEPSTTTVDNPWQKFFTFALTAPSTPETPNERRSALLVPDPPLDMPSRRDCPAQVPAVVIDLDDGATPFDPQRLRTAPPEIAAGLVRLRQAGIVVLWISQLPAARAADVGQALRTSGLDPGGEDQLLLIRSPQDRKELLRNDANEDVCVVAIAGDGRDDFDELFDYLRHPEQAVGLDAMLGKGWFLVPPLDAPAPVSK